ncbi:YjbH domain-containing protein [Pseudooceanicola marinus]|uniref:YjbH domain-containing protein n=1 Tax=Pseudooceanicola marinus TaxID=396013 RepID=UPI001CD21DEA|nr:YjbH domain-containing protein [Pseudooceanicola marinus]MCA1338186.1 YjbH domain-containing protein [Pseudooceanicola marinus]
MRLLGLKNRALMLAAGVVLTGTTGLQSQTEVVTERPLSPWDRPTLSFFGTPGLVDMPSADMMRDGDLSLSFNAFGPTQRYALTFQITPRLSGTFRYALIQDYDSDNRTRYDRSFDLRYRLVEERGWVPDVVIGLQDFGGTGIYAGEFLVAGKTLPGNLRVSAGLGWGRLATRDSFDNPLSVISDSFDRRAGFAGTGEFDLDNFFRGEAAFFGGIQWQATERLSMAVEYSTDTQAPEVDRAEYDYSSPLNFAATYRLRPGLDLTGAWMHGTTAGLMLNYTMNPLTPVEPSGTEAAPPPVVPRQSAAALGWGDVGRLGTGQPRADGGQGPDIRAMARAQMAALGLELMSFELSRDQVRLHMRNMRYPAQPEAIGRTARVLSGLLPPEVETIVIYLDEGGLTPAVVTLNRSDLESLEFDVDGSWKSFSRAHIRAAEPGENLRAAGDAVLPDTFPRLSYRLGGFVEPSYFDPDNPVRYNAGLQFDLDYEVTPGLRFSTLLRQPLIGNRDEVTRTSDSVLPHVRSDGGLYDRETDFEIRNLYGNYSFQPGGDLYGRVTAGYLEKMYAGVSGELLWKPVDSRLALGMELNYVQQRAFDGLFGLRDYEVATGHASAYYDMGNGFIGQVDAGRYLAKDWGATFSLMREFNNGFQVGAYFTLTDVSSEEFGEGAFDKGIWFRVPITWLSGTPSKSGFSQTLRPLTRDGGARLNVPERLYPALRGSQVPELEEDWGRFWK